MEFINNILQHPIYILLFGSGGLLAVIISVIALLYKRKNNDTNKNIIQRPMPQPRSNDEYSIRNNVHDRNYHLRIEEKEDTEQEAINFVTDLTMNSPVNDKISVSKVERKDFNNYL